MEHSYRLFLDNIEHTLTAKQHSDIQASLACDVLVNETTYRFLKEEITTTPSESAHRLYLTSSPRRQIVLKTKPKTQGQ